MPTPRQISWAKLRVTCVAITAAVIFSTLAYLLTGGTLLQPKTKLYLYANDATGLSIDSPVSVDGIDIGKVEKIALSGSNDPARTVRVTMKVGLAQLESVPDDSAAEISADSLVGDKYVDISSGKSPKHIPANGEIQFKSQPELMSRIDLPQFEKEIAQIDAVITDIEQGRTAMGQLITDDTAYKDLLHTLGQLESAFHKAMATTAQVGGALYTDAMYQGLAQPFVQLDQTLAEIQSGQGDMGRLVNDPAQYLQWVDSINSIRKQIESIGSGQFFQSNDLYQSWNSMIGSTIRQVDDFNANPMLNSTADYESWTGSMAELRKTMRDFHNEPAKYFRFRIF